MKVTERKEIKKFRKIIQDYPVFAEGDKSALYCAILSTEGKIELLKNESRCSNCLSKLSELRALLSTLKSMKK